LSIFRSLLIAPALLIGAAHAETLTGRVVGVADGDTITVLDAERQQHKIRLGGIDAPEKAQLFGQRPKENLSRLVFNKNVRIEWGNRDHIANGSLRNCQKSVYTKFYTPSQGAKVYS
jgi:endonuclease YncB( thermonuclease family)